MTPIAPTDLQMKRREVAARSMSRRRPPQTTDVMMTASASAFPEHSISTDAAISLVIDRGVSERAARRIASTARAGDINTRRTVAPMDWYRVPHSLNERLAICDAAGMDMATRAAGDALRAAEVAADEVGTVVFVSSTMLSMPSPDARLIHQLGLPTSVMRVPVWGRGCAGGAAGLGLAGRLAATSDDPVLLVVVETCTAHGHADDVSMLSLLIGLLYGDGASAMVLRRSSRVRSRLPQGGAFDGVLSPRIVGTDSALVTNTIALGGWDIDGGGLHYRHLAEISEVSSREVPRAVKSAATRLGFGNLVGSGQLWAALHPTSAAVMEAQAVSLGMHPDALRINLEVFARIGNTSAPSVLIALEEILRQAPQDSPVLALATGPGYSIEQVWFQT